MEIVIIELPREGIYKIKVDGQDVNGHIHSIPDTDRWEVWLNESKPIKVAPLSREAAAALVVYHHFEQERKRIKETRKGTIETS